MLSRATLIVVLLLALIVGLEEIASAQASESTAAPPGAPTPASDVPPGAPSSGPAGKVPDPEECTVRPLRKSVVMTLIRRSETGDSAVASPETVDPTVGEPADKRTRSAIRAIVREFAACNNAGDALRLLAMFSPRRLDTMWIAMDLEGDAAYQQLSMLVPPPPSQAWGIVKVEQIRVLDDGRVRAMVTIDFPRQVGIEPPNVFTFVKDGERWLIDDIAPVKETGSSD